MGFGGIGLIGDDLLYGIGGVSGASASIPATFPVIGACASVAKNVFKVKFTQALSAVPYITSYGSSTAFPLTGVSTATTTPIFTGNYSNSNKPIIHAIDTTREGPPSSSWYLASTIMAGAATCMLKGDASYLQFRYSVGSLTANASLTYNTLLKIPYGCYPTMDFQHDMVVWFTYTGPAPNVQFYANNGHLGGTESAPQWTEIVSGSQGAIYGNAVATNWSVYVNIPLVSTASFEVTKTIWVSPT